MQNCEINIDPFLNLRPLLTTTLSQPLQLLAFLEAEGISAFSFTYRSEIAAICNVPAMRLMSRARLNIRTGLDPVAVQHVMQLKPDLITLLDPQAPDQTLSMALPAVREMVDNIQAARDFNLALRIKPDLAALKAAYRLRVNAVELATDSLAAQPNPDDRLTELQGIVRTVRVALRNKFRVTLAGNLDLKLVKTLQGLVEIDYYSVGRWLLDRALRSGIVSALTEIHTTIEQD